MKLMYCNLSLCHYMYLQVICDMTQSIYIPRGINTLSLNREAQWDFQPHKDVKVSHYSIRYKLWLMYYMCG